MSSQNEQNVRPFSLCFLKSRPPNKTENQLQVFDAHRIPLEHLCEKFNISFLFFLQGEFCYSFFAFNLNQTQCRLRFWWRNILEFVFLQTSAHMETVGWGCWHKMLFYTALWWVFCTWQHTQTRLSTKQETYPCPAARMTTSLLSFCRLSCSIKYGAYINRPTKLKSRLTIREPKDGFLKWPIFKKTVPNDCFVVPLLPTIWLARSNCFHEFSWVDNNHGCPWMNRIAYADSAHVFKQLGVRSWASEWRSVFLCRKANQCSPENNKMDNKTPDFQFLEAMSHLCGQSKQGVSRTEVSATSSQNRSPQHSTRIAKFRFYQKHHLSSFPEKTINMIHLSQLQCNRHKKGKYFCRRFFGKDFDTLETPAGTLWQWRQSTLERDLRLTDVCCACHCLLRLPMVYPIKYCPRQFRWKPWCLGS